VSVHSPPRLNFETLLLLNLDFNADPDPDFHSNTVRIRIRLPKKMQIWIHNSDTPVWYVIHLLPWMDVSGPRIVLIFAALVEPLLPAWSQLGIRFLKGGKKTLAPLITPMKYSCSRTLAVRAPFAVFCWSLERGPSIKRMLIMRLRH
jgi:hypothetical protein